MVERKRNRRRGQGGENIAEKQEMTDMDAIFSPVSLDLFGRFRLVRSRRKTNLKTNQKGKKRMKTAVIYARYSSERQTEQSIEGQLRVCHEFAERNDLKIIDTYIDRAMTGTNDNRAAFQKMLSDSDKPQPWEIVLVYALDRFGRNSIEVAVNKQRLQKNGKILLIGVEHNRNTFIHSVDERMALPDRLGAPYAVTFVDHHGHSITHPMRPHSCSRTNDVSRFYVNFEKPFTELGAQKLGKLGNASIRILDACKCREIVSRIYARSKSDIFTEYRDFPETLYK